MVGSSLSGDVKRLLKSHASGQRAAAFGTCPQVGVAGHLHGGFGFSSLRWGLFLDQVVEMEVVTANGSIVTANNHTNSDLFWASSSFFQQLFA